MVGTLSFDYGSKHNHREVVFARHHAEMLGLPHEVVRLDFVDRLFSSDLLRSGGEVPEGHYEEANMKRTAVPFRNGIMLAVAAGYAESISAQGLVIAARAGDHAIYPDCREAFMGLMVAAIRLGTCLQLPQAVPLGPFEVAGLKLLRTAPESALLDLFGGNHAVGVTLYNETSRQLRLGGDLAFGGVRIGTLAERVLTLHNDGWEPLSIAGLHLPEGFSAAFEGRIDPGDPLEVVVTFTPTAEGPYAGELEAESDAPAGEHRIALSATGLAEAIAFEDWLANAGVPPEQAGPMEDPNDDGLPNLLAYLFNVDPWLAPPAGWRAALPATSLGSGTAGDHPPPGRFLVLTYRHNKHAVGIEVTLEASESLSIMPDSWQAVIPDAVVDAGTDPLTGDILRQLHVRIDRPDDPPQRFLRLRVEVAGE